MPARGLLARAGITDAALRLRRGSVDLTDLTSRWLARRRLECNGADMPAHTLAPRGPNNTFTTKQLFAYRERFACIPRPTEADFRLGYDRPGRHAAPMDRAAYTVGLTLRTLDGLFG